MNATRRRRTEITIETLERTTIRTRTGSARVQFCPTCGQDVGALAPGQAAAIFRVQELFLAELFVTNQIHRVNEIALCASSLVSYFR